MSYKLRLDITEKKALNHALSAFKGQAFVFGSRAEKNRKGGDIDLLLIPQNSKISKDDLSNRIKNRFVSQCDEKIDVVVLKQPMKPIDRAFFDTITKVKIYDH